jgi:hypothetical protein
VRHSNEAITRAQTAVGHNMVLPLMPEFITPQDGAEKQDCGRNAAKRWLQAERSSGPTASENLVVGRTVERHIWIWVEKDLVSISYVASFSLNISPNLAKNGIVAKSSHECASRKLTSNPWVCAPAHATVFLKKSPMCTVLQRVNNFWLVAYTSLFSGSFCITITDRRVLQ